MIRSSLLCVALAVGIAAPVVAAHPEGSPLNPNPDQHWIRLGSFTGPDGHGIGYTDLSAKDSQTATLRLQHQYLVDFWVVLDQPYDSEEGKLTEERYSMRIDCPSQSFGDDGSWAGFGPDGSVVSSQDSDSTTYSLSKVGKDDAPRHLLDAFCP